MDMPSIIVIEWENKPGTTLAESDDYANEIQDLLEPLDFRFCVRGFDDKGRYCKMTGYEVKGGRS